jgi:D-psicose/D-tagatose/L-ribulose 3-epimerase
MKIALCNEVVREMPFERQCAFAAGLGYDALEVAPFTLSPEPHTLSPSECARARRAADDEGIAISGLHWLLVAPPGLSITVADADVRERTLDVVARLLDVCAALGGRVVVHGSPAQRALDPDDLEGSRARGAEAFAHIASLAQAAGVTYCIEPLAREETGFVNTIAEAAAIVDQVANPALRTMLDSRAAALTEDEPLPSLVDRWLPSGTIAHVHVNDRTKLGPGQGPDRFAGLLAALRRNGYHGTVAVEPFEYRPDGPAAAARAIGYLRGVLEVLDDLAAEAVTPQRATTT